MCNIIQGASIRMFYGPHVCGEAVDMCSNEILTGSWRPEDQLEVWDFSTAKKITGMIYLFIYFYYFFRTN